MRKHLLCMFLTLTTLISLAQVPQKMSYQAVIRDSNNDLVTNQLIGVQINILKGSISGQVVYTATQSATTNDNGLLTMEIGGGSGFDTISWHNGPYFLETATDLNGGTNYSIIGISQILSVPYALHAETASMLTGPIQENDPVFTNSVAHGITGSDTAYWNHKLSNYNETDPLFSASTAAGITPSDTTSWNNKLDNFTETDPLFNTSVASGITSNDTAEWNNKLSSFTETDPLFSASTAAGITPSDTTSWNNKLDNFTEADPLFNTSVASGITSNDTAEWNNKLSSFNETDPLFSASTAAGITQSDTTFWNNKLDSYTETDPLFNTSVASGITSNDTADWNNKLSSFSEADPLFSVSTAAGITPFDTTSWNNKLDNFTETDPLFNTSVASGITSNDTAEWNNKLSSFSETDPLFSNSVASGINSYDTSYWNNKPDSITETQGLSDVLAINNDGTGMQIKNIANPVDSQDVATKVYVDDYISQLLSMILELQAHNGVTDIEGNHYDAVVINNQIWMTENLRTTIFNDSSPIPNVTVDTIWKNLSTPAYCWHNNQPSNGSLYGALYNWHVVETGKLCPEGWHVPTFTEWADLTNYLITNGYNFDSTYTGNKIAKSLGSLQHWSSSSVAGSVGNNDFPEFRNKTGFNALPGGFVDRSGNFSVTGERGIWWSSTEKSGQMGSLSVSLFFDRVDFFSTWHDYRYGMSVRCVKDN